MEINKIECKDCLEELPKIKDKCVDIIITDPPYFIGFNSSAKDNDGRQDYGNQTMLKPLFDTLFREWSRILKDTGRIFMFTDWRTYPIAHDCASKHIRISNMIVWDYGWIKAGTQYRFTHELILHCTKPKAASPTNRSTSDVWRIKPINFTQERHHQAEKPTEIIEKMLLETTNEGDLVLDCFMGSGTTAIACRKLKRDFIGYEINTKYIEVYEKRLKSVNEQQNLRDFQEK